MTSMYPPPADAVPGGTWSGGGNRPGPGNRPGGLPYGAGPGGPSGPPGPVHPAARKDPFWRAPFASRTWAELLYGLIGVPLAAISFACAQPHSRPAQACWSR